MHKIAVLTFHYTNNYGGILQALALEKSIETLGFIVEIINFVPSKFKSNNIRSNLSINRNFCIAYSESFSIIEVTKKAYIMLKHGNRISRKFDDFRNNEMQLSKCVDERTIIRILNDYDTVIVGSDQIWNPSQRKNPIYFLNFGDKYTGKKISYAADSTVKEVDKDDIEILKSALSSFDHISVRNEHSLEFVRTVLGNEVEVVADPTLLFDFEIPESIVEMKNDYILMYVLGKEIAGTHEKAIEKIRNKYGNIPVYSIKIPTMNFELSSFADKVFYDLDPAEWLNMFINAKFVYTDSFHGVLFSLKYHKPFLAYYTEVLRSTRFIDLGKRYGIDTYIVQNVSEIDDKRILDDLPDFSRIDNIIDLQKKTSIEFLKKALSD